MNYKTSQAFGNRPYQEDSFICAPPFFAVADGMGGHGAGDVASRALLAGMKDFLKTPGASFREAVSAGRYRMTLTPEAHYNPRMGTTLTAVWVGKKNATWLQVGDSRLYHLRHGKATQVTVDECLGYPQDNVLTRCVGVRADLDWPEGSYGRIPIEKGDFLVLCSDGVSFYLDPDPQRADNKGWTPGCQITSDAEAMVQRAIEMGGHDNATAVVIEI